jgi:hypothetical protein
MDKWTRISTLPSLDDYDVECCPVRLGQYDVNYGLLRIMYRDEYRKGDMLREFEGTDYHLPYNATEKKLVINKCYPCVNTEDREAARVEELRQIDEWIKKHNP